MASGLILLVSCTGTPPESLPFRPGAWKAEDGSIITLNEDSTGTFDRVEVSADGTLQACEADPETDPFTGPISWSLESDLRATTTLERDGVSYGDELFALGPPSDRWAIIGRWTCGEALVSPGIEYARVE